MNKNNLTQGSILKNLIYFSIPYLISCFLQSFYGLADLFITGQFNSSEAITAVSVGSQVMHMLTVIIAGIAMGLTVNIGHSIGSKNEKKVKKIIGNSLSLFFILALVLMGIFIFNIDGVISILQTPKEAATLTKQYLLICLTGTLFITFYNVLSGIFRGIGDTKTPMIFVGIAGIVNIFFDYILIGTFSMGAKGAALATVLSQAISVFLCFFYAFKKIPYFKLSIGDFKLSKDIFSNILKIGLPIACQDGFIQVSFLVITVIANSRGLAVSAAVGIVEKLISFMFLVPSAMLSSVSAIASQCAGANLHKRARKTLYYGIALGVLSGIFFTTICLLMPYSILRLFASKDEQVIFMGAQYLRTYVFDCIVASVHFCFSGFFCAYEKSYLSFIHNTISILAVRIPGAYLASILYPSSLLPMGMAAPAGSLLSSIICIIAYYFIFIRPSKISRDQN